MKNNEVIQLLILCKITKYISGFITASWFLIAFGWNLPTILNGYIGTGTGYQFAS